MTDNTNGVPPMGTPAENTGAARSDDPFKAFVEHQRKALEETGKALDALLPDGFKEHSAEARREFVKGMKVLVDAALSELERASRDFERGFNRRAGADADSSAPSSDDRPSSTGASKVKVQVD